MLKKAKAKLKLNKSKKHPRIFIQLGAKPMYTTIHKSYFTDLINFAGAINSVPLTHKSAHYSREKVIIDNPDYIFILDMGIIGKKEKKEWAKFNTIDAVKNKKVYIIDASKLGSPTPFTLLEMIETIYNKIHKKIL